VIGFIVALTPFVLNEFHPNKLLNFFLSSVPIFLFFTPKDLTNPKISDSCLNQPQYFCLSRLHVNFSLKAIAIIFAEKAVNRKQG
jgi:hypothetical protein